MPLTDYLVILMFLTFVGLIMTGIPIAYCLAGTGMIFAFVGYLSDQYLGTVTGLDYNFIGIIVSRIYVTMTNWVLIALPLFIFMGLMLDRSGIAENLMKSLQELFGRVRGGLAVTVTLIGVILAACTGIVGASVVLLGLLSLPIMLKQGYSKELSLGTIAAAGTLGILIPPSVMLVVMADQLALSVGDLFMGAVFPGLMLSAMYVVYLLIYCYLKPKAAPLPAERVHISLMTILSVLKNIIPPAILIVGVMGSIFFGIATVTEASGVGVLGSFILALMNRKISFAGFKEVLYNTYNITAYIFGILIGASFFALVLRGLGGDQFIERILVGMSFGSYGVIIFVVFCIFFLGFFLDWIEISLIVLPLVAPVIPKLGLGIPGFGVVDNPSLVWFAVLIAVTLQTSFLTPPVGFSLFYLKGVAPPEVTLSHIYRGVIPFIVLQMICVILVLLWPQLVTWLPAVTYR
ncbi:MAG: TRAP transporter large permease subunit [Desulfobacterales bacterium]|nr:TRAP transporter large permease subunit [Desulfobacterales bacterium]